MDSDANSTGDWAAPGSSVPPPGWSTEQPPPQYGAPPPPTPYGWGYGAPPPPQPGIIPLRPLGVGEILDGAFTAIRRYPRATLGLAACVMLVVTVVQVATEWYLLSGIAAPAPNETLSQASDYLARAGTAAVVDFVVTTFGTLLLSGLITAVIGEGVLGRPVTAGDAWQRLRPVFWRLVGVTVVTFVITFGTIVPGILAIVFAPAIFAVLLILAAVPVGVWLWISFSLAPAIVVLEGQTVRGALRRSRALVQNSWWRVFGIILLAGVIAAAVSGVISIPFGLAGGGLTTLGDNTDQVAFSQLVVSAIGGLIASTVARPFSAGVSALLYIDRRIRAEALDLTLARAAAERPGG